MITCVESGLLKVWKEGSTETVSQCDFSVLQCGGLYIDNLLYNKYTFTHMALLIKKILLYQFDFFLN